MSKPSLSRRVLGAVAGASLLIGLVPVTASAATPEKRDITEFACPADEVPDPGFSDDENTTAEHKASIACIVWYELARGRTTTTYGVGLAVNRGQMATFIGNLVVAGGVSLSDSPPDAFEDDDDTEHEKRINQLAAIGVVEGDDEGNYNPSAPVTRAQMASFLNRAYEEITGAALTSSEDYFTDDDGAFHEDNINAVAGAGIAAGKTSTTYDPAGSVLREQMATFLARETDLLVEKGKIDQRETKPADVVLDQTSVTQGGKVTGKIVTEEGFEISGAKVTGCGITDQELTLSGTDDRFEFTIPVTQTTGKCTLTFTVDREEGDSVTDEEDITVTSGTSRTDAPELTKVEKTSESGDTVTLTYTFDETLKNVAPAAGDFRIYDASANQTPATSATLSGSTVNAVFPKDDFADATTATVTANAVEDSAGVANPEGAAALSQQTTTVSGTSAPDLVDIARSGNEWFFDFDETIVAHPGSADDYHLVLDDGNVLDGLELTDETGDDVVQVTFPPVEDARTVVRGWVATDTVAGSAQDGNPLNGVEDGNPTHAEDEAGGGESPYLVSATIDATNNKVIYQFNRSVVVPSRSTFDTATYFIAYDLAGNEVATNDATASGSTVTATFSGSSDPITGSTVGASVRDGAVRSATGTRLLNRVDEVLVKTSTTVTGARGGETSAPDLRSVTRSIDGNDSVVTYTFDAPVSFGSTTSPTDGDFAIYRSNGDRTELSDCSTSGNTVECRAVSTSTEGQLIDDAVLGGVEYDAVRSTSSTNPRSNYEASAPIS